jgi:CRISPR-associated exonuclease Cas4
MLLFIVVLLILLLLGLAALLGGWHLRRRTGIPAGEVVYRDTGEWQRVEQPLLSRRYGLVGRPDYLVQVSKGRQRFTIPVEVKSRKRPARLVEAHVLQLAAYCLLVEEAYQVTPPYGLLHYADATLEIPFSTALRGQVIEAAEAIRRSRSAADLSRSHDEAGRCQGCSYRSACGVQAL